MMQNNSNMLKINLALKDMTHAFIRAYLRVRADTKKFIFYSINFLKIKNFMRKNYVR